MKKPKEKGNSFERKISKELSNWWTNNKSDSIFWRSDNSGGRATVRAKKGLKTSKSYGDITTIDNVGDPLLEMFCIELKKGYTSKISLLDIIEDNILQPLLIKFWEKNSIDTKLAEAKFPLLIFERNRKNAVIAVPVKVISELEKYCGVWKENNIIVKYGKYRIFFVKLNHFLKWCNPNDIIDFLNGKI